MPIRIFPVFQCTDAAWLLLEEYYEAIEIVVRDSREQVDSSLRGGAARLWLASLDEQPVGCVMLRSLGPGQEECKRLFVQPSARGRGIADALLQEMEADARRRGSLWVYLDTHHGLTAAIAAYRKRGYEVCERYNENPQATLFMRKCLNKVGSIG